MTELNASTLSQLPPKVAAPPYDRSRLKRGIAHFGVANFHRAHQAFYIDRCLALRVIGAQADYLLGPAQPDEVLALLTSPDLRIVTLTVTEGDYHVDPQSN